MKTETNDTEKKRSIPTTVVGTFPHGGAVASVKIKAGREPTVADLKQAKAACVGLAEQLQDQIDALA